MRGCSLRRTLDRSGWERAVPGLIEQSAKEVVRMTPAENPNATALNAFVHGAFSTFTALLGQNPVRGEIRMDSSGTTNHQVNVIIGLAGDAFGHVVLGMSLSTADKIASTMNGSPVRTFNSVAAQAVSDLAGVLCSSALTKLAERGMNCVLTPPTIVKGVKPFGPSEPINSIVVPLLLHHGAVTLSLAIRATGTIEAAA
jgi:chemotaxis protein CheX